MRCERRIDTDPYLQIVSRNQTLDGKVRLTRGAGSPRLICRCVLLCSLNPTMDNILRVTHVIYYPWTNSPFASPLPPTGLFASIILFLLHLDTESLTSLIPSSCSRKLTRALAWRRAGRPARAPRRLSTCVAINCSCSYM